MKEAYAGGGEDWVQDQYYDPYYDQHVQNVAQQMMGQYEETQTASALPRDDIAEGIIHEIGDAVGYWPLLICAIVGFAYLGRKRLRKALKAFLDDKEEK